MKCRICSEQHYHQTYSEPEEPCICGHGVTHDSPWAYAGWRGIMAYLRYTILRKSLEWLLDFVYKWQEPLYKEWKY